jgi:hypothetical protein
MYFFLEAENAMHVGSNLCTVQRGISSLPLHRLQNGEKIAYLSPRQHKV